MATPVKSGSSGATMPLPAGLFVVAPRAGVEFEGLDALGALQIELLGCGVGLGERLLLLEEDPRDLVGRLLVQGFAGEEEVRGPDRSHLLVETLAGARRCDQPDVDCAEPLVDVVQIEIRGQQLDAVGRSEVGDCADRHASSPEERIYGAVADGVHRLVDPELLFEVLPLSRTSAYDLLDSLTGAPLLKGYRGRPPADVEALVGAVCRVASAIGAAGDRMEEFEINPLLVYAEGEGVLAIDLMIRTAPYGE